MFSLNNLQSDAISECMNIGVGSAAATLSQMLSEDVSLSIPEVVIVALDHAARKLHEQYGRVSVIHEEFAGPFEGNAILVFKESKATELAHAVGGKFAEQNKEMEVETLKEIGNIIINACLSSIADVLGEEIKTEIPDVKTGIIGNILNTMTQDGQDEAVLCLRMKFSTATTNVEGNINVLMNLDSVQQFLDKLNKLYRGLLTK